MITLAKEKTWSYNVNNLVNSTVAQTDHGMLIFALKSSLVGAGWTVRLSSNRTSFGAADYWSTYADVVFVGGEYGSWIVLRSPSVSGGIYEILIGVSGNSSANNCFLIYVSKSAFSGGTLTALPTSASQVAIQGLTTGASHVYALRYTTTQKYWHAAYTSDFSCFRFFVLEAGYCVSVLLLESLKGKPTDMVAADNWHVTYYAGGTTVTDKPTVANLCDASANGFGYYSTTPAILAHYLSCEGCADEPLADICTAYSPEEHATFQILPAFPVGVIGYQITSQPAAHYTSRGQLYDMYWGSNTLVTGSTCDGAGTKQWVKMGALWMPWNGSTPLIS